LDELIEEQTAGGLNEKALQSLESLGALEFYDNVMDAILKVASKADQTGLCKQLARLHKK
jgi:hypothetical protein